MKNNNGITIIALVITIIVLLLLAGISISMLSGENSIITKAKDAKVQMGDAQYIETLKLKITESLTYDGKPNIEVLVPKLEEIGCTVSGDEYPLDVSYKDNNYIIEENGKLQPVNKTEEYKEVEYIESTGTQYIDTGYIPKTNTKLELTLSFSGEFSQIGDNTVIFFSATEESDEYGINFGGNDSRF